MTGSGPTRVVFRCDAGPVLGVGHVMRCVALAEELAARGAECVFAADLADVPWAAEQVGSRGFGIVQLADVPAAEAVAALLALRPDAVVLDTYYSPPEVGAKLRAAGSPVLAIIDGDVRGQVGDIYVDQNLGSEAADGWSVSGAGPAGAVRLAGLDYALLRDEVRRLRPPAPPGGAFADPPRVLAYFGGTDAFGASPPLLDALARTGRAFDATIVAPRPQLRAALGEVALHPGQHFRAIDPTGALMSLAAEADLVISASGTSLWELLCIGAAAAVVWVVDNQRLGYDRVIAAGTAAGLGHLDDVRADPGPAAALLDALLGDVTRRDRLRVAGWRLVDGRGRERVADALLDLTRR
jgi:spore coat polysaccharide biosynthesis predicted glycosyltransferase SpsG